VHHEPRDEAKMIEGALKSRLRSVDEAILD